MMLSILDQYVRQEDFDRNIVELRKTFPDERTEVKEIGGDNNNLQNNRSRTQALESSNVEEDLKRKVVKNYRFLKSEIDGKYLVDSFLQEGEITRDEHEEVTAISTRLRRTETFLNILLSKSTTSNVFSLFCKCLKDENYQKACSILDETVLENAERRRETDADIRVSNIVTEHYSFLASELDGQMIAEILFEKEILPFGEFDKIIKTQSTAKKRRTEEFLSILQHQRIPGIYNALRPILEEIDEEFVKLFENNVDEDQDVTCLKEHSIVRSSHESGGSSVKKSRKRKADDSNEDGEQPVAKRTNVWTYDNISVTTTVSDGILNWSIPLDQLEDLKTGVRLTFNIEKNDKEETEAKMLQIIDENDLGERIAETLRSEEVDTSHQSNQKGSIVIRLNIDSENTIRRLRLALKTGTMQKILNVLFKDENIKNLFQGSEFKLNLSIDTDVSDGGKQDSGGEKQDSLSDGQKKELKKEQCRILKNYTFLLEEIDAKNLKNTFVKEKIFTEAYFDKILDIKNSTREQRTSRFLRQLLQSRDPKTYDIFYDALEACRLHDVAQTLLETSGDQTEGKESSELVITPTKEGETSNLIRLQLGLKKTLTVSSEEESEKSKSKQASTAGDPVSKSPVPRKREHVIQHGEVKEVNEEENPPEKERKMEKKDDK